MRKIKSHVLVLGILSGCATAPQVVKNIEATEYTRGVTSVPFSTAKGSCPKDISKITEAKWKSIVVDGNACVRAGQWSSVQQIGDKLALREPNSPWGIYFLSLAAEFQGSPDRAQWMIELALKKAPETGILRFQKGRLLWSQGDFRGAMEEMGAAIRLDPTLTDAHLFLGQIYYRDQDYDPAAQHFYQVLTARPEDSIALSGLVECRLHKGDTVGALEIIKRGVRAHPTELSFRVREAQIYETYLNQPNEALKIYLDAKKISARSKKPAQLAVDLDERVRNLSAAMRAPASVADANKEKGAKKQ